LFRPERKLIVRNACFLDAPRLFLSRRFLLRSVARASASQRGKGERKKKARVQRGEYRWPSLLFGHSSHLLRALPRSSAGKISSSCSSFVFLLSLASTSAPPLLMSLFISPTIAALAAARVLEYFTCAACNRGKETWSSEEPAGTSPFFPLPRAQDRPDRISGRIAARRAFTRNNFPKPGRLTARLSRTLSVTAQD